MARALSSSLFVPLLLLLHTHAAPVPKHLMPKDDATFCAYQVGDRLVHDLGEREVVEVVTHVEKTDAGMKVTFEWVAEDGSHSPAKTVIASARGLQIVDYAGRHLDPPMWDLKLPHRDENRWSETWEPGNETWKLETAGWEEVTVLAGTIRAMRVDRLAISNEPEVPPTRTTYWYAPGIGCVKISTGTPFRELKSFSHKN